jgi:hypothetical protein
MGHGPKRRIVLHSFRENYATTNWLVSAVRQGSTGRSVVGAALLDHEIFQQKTVVRWRQRLFALNAKDGPILALIVFRFQNAHELVRRSAIRAVKIYGWASGHNKSISN